MSLQLPSVPESLDGISPLLLGGAIFNTQYNDNPHSMPVAELLETAFKLGINAIDTSPYYGPSEILLGSALGRLTEQGKITRNNYYICTKVGRLHLDDFDYSPEWIVESVKRSLKRFQTEYLDVVYLHDIEFKTYKDTMGALQALMDLKKEGLIRWVGISGYPVKYLYQVANAVKNEKCIGDLDLILSYSNMCLQNIILAKWYEKFLTDTGVKLVNNASILSMSLLRSQETRSFHPAPQELRDKCAALAKILLEKYDIELAELSTRFAIREWLNKKGRTVLGVSSIPELENAWTQYELVLSKKLDERDDKLVKFSQKFLGEHFNETWASGIEH